MRERAARPRLVDVAREAGISKAAASYVLNGRLGVSEETRDRVLGVAMRMGYRHRGGAAGPLRGMAAGSIGVLLSPTRRDGEAPNYFVAELLAGVDVEARRQRQQLRVSWWEPEAAIESLPGVDGVLLLGGSFDPDALLGYASPLVLVGASFPKLQADAVLADNRQAAYLATAHLLRRGRRRPVLLNGPGHSPTTSLKEVGYREALIAGAASPESPAVRVDFTVEAGEAAARSLLTGPHPPDGIVAGDDVIAIGALHAAQAVGARVPEDVAVIGFGDSPEASVMRPHLSSVHLFLREMGALSVRRLLDRIRGPGERPPAVRSLVSPRLVARASTGGSG